MKRSAEDEESYRTSMKAWLRTEIDDGLAEIERGGWVDGDEAYRQATEAIERAQRRR